MQKGETWGPKGAATLADVMVIKEATPDTVTAYKMMGGYLGSISRGTFEEKYEQFDKARIAEMRGRFVPVNFALEYFEDEFGPDFSIPGFSNGEGYSAGERPFFEKDVVLEHIKSGLLADTTTKVWFDEELDTFVEIISQDATPKDIPGDLDVKPLVAQAVSEGGGAHIEHPELGTLYVAIAGKYEFETEGRKVTAYNVFDGWAWLLNDPAPAAAAAP